MEQPQLQTPAPSGFASNPNSEIFFTDQPQMSARLVESRIDNHLMRIMKHRRWVKLYNTIRFMPVHSRICEKLLEIMNAMENFMRHKTPKVEESIRTVQQLREYYRRLEANEMTDFECKEAMMEMLDRIHQVSIFTGQFMWALNCNNEHLRYVARVYPLPEKYFRSGDEWVSVRTFLTLVAKRCENTITVCRLIRNSLASTIKNIYGYAEDFHAKNNDDDAGGGGGESMANPPGDREGPSVDIGPPPVVYADGILPSDPPPQPEQQQQSEGQQQQQTRSNYVSSPIYNVDCNC